MIKPKRLQKGDTIGIPSVAGPVKQIRLKRGIRNLEKLGYKVRLAENVWLRTGYLSGDDDQRAEGLNQMFADDSIDAIICARGGFGSIRILDLIDYALIRKHPKILMGFSDITLIHQAINKLCKLVTFHGPMVAVDFNDLSAYNKSYFLKSMSSPRPIGGIQNSPCLGKWKILAEGRALAPILGGNLTLITRLLGTKYEADFREKILFLEDLNEDIYKIDGMLAQLKLAGILKRVKGLILAEFVGCKPSKKASFSLEEVFDHYFASANYPVIYPVSCGHGTDKITIPLGLRASIDTSKGIFSIDEAGVR